MNLHKIGIAVVVLLAAICFCSVVQAEYLDAYLSNVAAPPDPVVEPDGSVTWSSDWVLITLPYTLDPALAPHESIYLGLENGFVPNKIKMITLEYEAIECVTPERTRAGYPPNTLETKPWDGLTHGYSSQVHRHLVEGVIEPQSSWEWIVLTNHSDSTVPLVILDFTSKCVPEPTILLLLATGGLVLLITRRRR